MLTTFSLAKTDHRWVTFISLKTITLASAPPEVGGLTLSWPDFVLTVSLKSD